jgi:hypothetical protein
MIKAEAFPTPETLGCLREDLGEFPLEARNMSSWIEPSVHI